MTNQEPQPKQPRTSTANGHGIGTANGREHQTLKANRGLTRRRPRLWWASRRMHADSFSELPPGLFMTRSPARSQATAVQSPGRRRCVNLELTSEFQPRVYSRPFVFIRGSPSRLIFRNFFPVRGVGDMRH